MKSIVWKTHPMTSLTAKLMATLIILVTLVMGAVMIYWLNSQQQRASAELESHATQMTMLLSKTCAGPLWNIDLKSINDQLASVMADRQVFSADLYVPGREQPLVAKKSDRPVVDPIEREAAVIYVRDQPPLTVQVGTIRLVYTRYYMHQMLAHTRLLISVVVLILLTSLCASTYILLRKMVKKPVGELVAMAQRIAEGDFTTTITVSSRDELGVLAGTFNFMTVKLRDLVESLEQRNKQLSREVSERKQAEEEKENLQSQLLQAQKMEFVGRLAGGVAHDFNNILGVILGFAELGLAQIKPGHPLHANLAQIQSAGNRAADLTRQLLAFARKQTISPKILDLNETVTDMLGMLRRLIGEDIDLVWLPGEQLWSVKMDPSQVDQILANLCLNARDAIAGVGRIAIETANISFDETYCVTHVGFVPGDYVQLTVSDDGSGIGKDVLDQIFEPFFTTKEMGKGTGLGLSTVYGIVKQNGGFINVYSEPGEGTTFRIYLTRYLGESERVSAESQFEETVSGNETILLVEDEPALIDLCRTMLESLGYRVLAAGGPGEAISLAEKHGGEIDLVLTDVVMPEMNGSDLCKRLMAFYPNLKRLFMSGHTANVIAHHGVLEEGVCFIQKPFSLVNLSAKVRETLRKE